MWTSSWSPVLYAGGGKYIETINWIPIIFIESFVIIAVNVFVLISGYFSIKLRLSSLLRFAIVCSLFLLFHLLLKFVCFDEPIFLWDSVQVLMPISRNTAWFVKCYFMLMLLSPILNRAFDSITKNQAWLMLVSLLFINVYMGFIHRNPINTDGYTLAQMVLIYFIGRMLNYFQVPNRMSRCKWCYIYIMLSLVLALCICVCIRYSPMHAFRLLSYNNPLVVGSAICFFSIFVLCNFQNHILNYLATGVFGIYLIHQNYPFWFGHFVPFMRTYYYHRGLFVFVGVSIVSIVCFIVMGLLLNLFINYLVRGIFSMNRIAGMLNKYDRLIKYNFL